MTDRLRIFFDGDASQFLPSGGSCIFCEVRQSIDDGPLTFIRVRERTSEHNTRDCAWVCPDCVARAFLQVSRLGLWTQVSGQVLAAIRRHFARKPLRLESKE